MTCCPKCSSDTIIGPKYEQDCFGERLRYTCFRCGYATTTPTNDAKRQPLAAPVDLSEASKDDRRGVAPE